MAQMMFTLKPLKVTVEATFTLSWLDSRYTPNKDFIVDGFKLIFQQSKIWKIIFSVSSSSRKTMSRTSGPLTSSSTRQEGSTIQ